MELRHYIALARRWAWLLLLSGLLAGVGAYYFATRQTPIYSATSTVLLDASNRALNGDASNYTLVLLNERLTRTYAELLTQSDTVNQVLDQYGSRPSVLIISGTTRRDTSLMDITVESEEPTAAAFVANEIPLVINRQQQARQASRFAATLMALNEELARVEEEAAATRTELRLFDPEDPDDRVDFATLSARLDQQERRAESLRQNIFSVQVTQDESANLLSIIEPAQVPQAPIRPSPLRNALTAAVVGVLLAGGAAFLIEYLDSTVKQDSDLAGLFGLTILGMVGRLEQGGRRVLLTALPAQSAVAEAFRILRTNIRFALVDEAQHNTLLVTSPGPEEGKSTTAANLALVLAQAGHPTVLVDADLRRPRQHAIFQISNSTGLTTALVERNSHVRDFLQETSIDGLHLLPAGPIPPNPSELLGSHRMREVMEQLQETSEFVVIDTSPVLAVADSSILASIVSGVLLILRADATTLDAVRRTVEQLDAVQGRILGTVLNDVRSDRSGYYYYHYSERPAQNRRTLGTRLRTLLLSVLPLRRS